MRNGIDRIDSSKGYSVDNCVPCCAKCNYAKHDLSIDDFKNHIEKIYKHLFLESSTTIPAGSTSEAKQIAYPAEAYSALMQLAISRII